MKVTDLPQGVTLYRLAKVLGITAPAAYRYQKANKIPDIRVYQLKKLKPEWVKDDLAPREIVKNLLEEKNKRSTDEQGE